MNGPGLFPSLNSKIWKEGYELVHGMVVDVPVMVADYDNVTLERLWQGPPQGVQSGAKSTGW